METQEINKKTNLANRIWLFEMLWLIEYFNKFYNSDAVNVDLWFCGNIEMKEYIKTDLEKIRKAESLNELAVLESRRQVSWQKRVEGIPEIFERFFCLCFEKAKESWDCKTENIFSKHEVQMLKKRFPNETEELPVLQQWVEFLERKAELTKYSDSKKEMTINVIKKGRKIIKRT